MSDSITSVGGRSTELDDVASRLTEARRGAALAQQRAEQSALVKQADATKAVQPAEQPQNPALNLDLSRNGAGRIGISPEVRAVLSGEPTPTDAPSRNLLIGRLVEALRAYERRLD